MLRNPETGGLQRSWRRGEGRLKFSWGLVPLSDGMSSPCPTWRRAIIQMDILAIWGQGPDFSLRWVAGGRSLSCELA